MIVLQILLIGIGSYLTFYALFWLLHVLPFKRKESDPVFFRHSLNRELLLILPAFKPGKVFFEVLDRLEEMQKDNPFSVYVLLQDASPSFRPYAEQKGFFVEEKSFSRLPGNSYQHALRHISATIQREWGQRWNPEFVMLVDKDNLLDKNFFTAIPSGYFTSYDVIQGKRAALGTHNALSFYDSLSELLNDRMFRTAKTNLGGMVEISGSGALIETELFMDAIERLDPNAPGFDKNFMIQLLTSQRDVRTIFHPQSMLFEEKTSEWDAHGPQRVRWFGEQYFNALHHSKDLWKAFIRFHRGSALDYLITLWRPPRSLQIVLTAGMATLEVIIWLITGWWMAIVPLFSVALLVLASSVIVFLLTENKLTQALRHSLVLPRLAFQNLKSATRSFRKENQGTFIHTSHKL